MTILLIIVGLIALLAFLTACVAVHDLRELRELVIQLWLESAAGREPSADDPSPTYLRPVD